MNRFHIFRQLKNDMTGYVSSKHRFFERGHNRDIIYLTLYKKMRIEQNTQLNFLIHPLGNRGKVAHILSSGLKLNRNINNDDQILKLRGRYIFGGFANDD